MQQITAGEIRTLLTRRESPCVSIYQPTHRHHPSNAQDPIRFRNLLTQAARSLELKYPERDVRVFLARGVQLADDRSFWQNRKEGLALLISPSTFRIVELQRRVPELAIVAESFHLKPLLRIVQSADRYQILALNRHRARMFEGNRDALDEIPEVGFPSTIVEALGGQLTEPYATVGSYGGRAAAGEGGMHHGHGSRKDEIDKDMERFFRIIDQGVIEHHSRPSGLPIILAALPEYHTHFRGISHNAMLLDQGVTINADSVSTDQLRDAAWRVMEPRYLARLAALVDDYESARARGSGSADISEVATAAVAGRVATLLVDADRQVAGRILTDTGGVKFGTLSDPDTDDLLDDVASLTLRMGGHVVVVPSDRMPGTTGLAATFRG